MIEAGILSSITNFVSSLASWSLDSITNFVTNQSPQKVTKDFFLKKAESIKTKAQQQIMYFPVIASDSCSKDLVLIVRTAVEQQCAIFAKIAIEQVGSVRLKDNMNKASLIKTVMPKHDGLVNMIESSPSFTFPAKTLLPEFFTLWEDGKWDMGEVDEGLNTDAAGLFVRPLHEATGSYEAAVQRGFQAGQNKVQRAHQRAMADNQRDFMLQMDERKAKREEKALFDKKLQAQELEKLRAEHRRLEKEEDYNFRKKLMDRQAASNMELRNIDRLEDLKVEKGKARDAGRIGNSRITIEQKINKAQPLIIQCEVEWVSEYAIQPARFSVGVKSALHVVPGSEIVKFLPDSRYNGKFIVKLAKLFSGEISFFREFLLHIDTIEGYFDKNMRGQNSWYTRLKRMGDFNATNTAIGQFYMPTATLVVSMLDVDEIFRLSKNKINFLDSNIVENTMHHLCLLNFIIVDESSEKVLWYDERSRSFDTYSSDDLENEVKSGISKNDALKMVVAAGRAR